MGAETMKKSILKTTLLLLATLQTVTGRCPAGQSGCQPSVCFKVVPPPPSIESFKPFEEKRYWLEENVRTGEPQICWQRLFLRDNLYETETIRCFLAEQLQTTNAISEGLTCWYATTGSHGIVLCSNDTGKLTLTEAEKICGAAPADSIVLGQVKNSKYNMRKGGPATCTVVKKETKKRIY